MQEDKPFRKRLRLKGYDYNNNGAYFITFCVKDHQERLGQVVGCDALGAPCMRLSPYGEVLRSEIEVTASYYDHVAIDKFVIMPNHVHMILSVVGDAGRERCAGGVAPYTALVPRIVGVIKRKTNKAYGFDMWQTSYHDHIIRSQASYQRIWRYIDENPARWTEDVYYTGHNK